MTLRSVLTFVVCIVGAVLADRVQTSIAFATLAVCMAMTWQVRP